MGYREHLAVDLSAEGVNNDETPSSEVNFTQSRFTNAIVIRVDELGDGHASNGFRALDFEVVHLGEGGNEAMETAIAASIVYLRWVSKKLADRRYPGFVHSAVVRRIVERAEFNGDSTTTASIWKSRMNRSRGYQPTRHGQYPELYGIGAEQGFPAGIGHLEVVIPIGESSSSCRCAWPRPPVEINA